MMDALYLLRNSAHDDFEIRHSLRSLERHAPWVRKVWIFGDRPKFLGGDISVIEHVPEGALAPVLGVKTPVTNFFLLNVLSSLIPELTPEYLHLSDDFFLLRDLPIAEARKDRYLEEMSGQARGRGVWRESLWRTHDLLKSLGYTGYNTETHVPTYLTKKRVLEAYCEFKAHATEDRHAGMMGLTAILNHALAREKMSLVKLSEENSRCGFWRTPPSYAEVAAQSEGKTFFNFDDGAWGEGIRKFLAERFPEKSRFEQ